MIINVRHFVGPKEFEILEGQYREEALQAFTHSNTASQNFEIPLDCDIWLQYIEGGI
jgi:hypothetical protein